MLQALCLLLQLSTIFRVVSLYHPEYSTNPNLLYPLQVGAGRGLGSLGLFVAGWASAVLCCDAQVR